MEKLTDIIEGASGVLGELTGRRYKVRLIEGDRLGSSGYYPAETLLRDGPRIFKKGTPMYLNHQTPEERERRPFGSVQEYAGELAEDAYYENDGLYAEIEVFEHQIPMIKSLKDKIGISIRARGKSVVETINGKAVPVFKELVEARSADFVVRAGAGGKIVSILESATEDSGESSETEEGRQVMDEALKAAIEGLADTNTKILEALEALKPAPVVENSEPVEESAVNPLEVAKELADSELSEQGRERVLERFGNPGNKKTLTELIEAEEAYVKAVTETLAEEEGSVEEVEAEESAKTVISLPSVWKKKDN